MTYIVRQASRDDIRFLPDIERAAGLLFKTYAGDLGLTDEIYEGVNSLETFQKAQQAERLWVSAAASGEVVGFALVVDLEGYAHLDELDVLPSHGRRGVGSALLDAVCAWANDTGYPAVTLRTFRDVPWNGPFYRRQGFDVVDSAALSAAHSALEALESRRGLRIDLRVTMARRPALTASRTRA